MELRLSKTSPNSAISVEYVLFKELWKLSATEGDAVRTRVYFLPPDFAK